MTKKTVYKTVGGESYEEFNKAVNTAVREGWAKTENTVFASDGVHASLSATVDKLLVDFPKKAETELRASEYFSEKFAQLHASLHLPKDTQPKSLPSGALCKLTFAGEVGRFEYRGKIFDLAAVVEKTDSLPELVVVCREGSSEPIGGTHLTYQL